MTRAEMRRQKKEEEKKKKKVYNFTQEQLQVYLDRYFEAQYNKKKDEIFTDCMVLTLMLPLRVLMENYWKKTFATKAPKFVGEVLELFCQWENGELDIEELKKELWQYGGVTLTAEGKDSGIFE